MKLAIVTRADEGIKNIIEITHPKLRKYAQFCKADFIHEFEIVEELPHPHYRILICDFLLEEYDRILVIDSDVLITKNCPNIFDEVPNSHVGTVLEDKGSRQLHRRDLIRLVQKERGDIGWKEGYINTGVFVISKEHLPIFKEVDKNNLWLNFGQDDIELGYQINKLNVPIHELDYKWNHMSMWSEEWNNSPSRFDSYFIHYAGMGHIPFLEKYDQIHRDYMLLKRYGLLF